MITLLSSCHGMTTSGVTGIHSNSISFLDRSQNIRVHCFKKKEKCPILMYCSFISFEAKLEEKNWRSMVNVSLMLHFLWYLQLTCG